MDLDDIQEFGNRSSGSNLRTSGRPSKSLSNDTIPSAESLLEASNVVESSKSIPVRLMCTVAWSLSTRESQYNLNPLYDAIDGRSGFSVAPVFLNIK